MPENETRRPVNINTPNDMSPNNLMRNYDHYDRLLRKQATEIGELQNGLKSALERIAALEAENA